MKFAVIAVSALIAIAACAWGVETSHTFLKQATCSAEAPVIAESLVEALNGPSGGTLTLLPYDGSDVDMQLIATDNEGDD